MSVTVLSGQATAPRVSVAAFESSEIVYRNDEKHSFERVVQIKVLEEQRANHKTHSASCHSKHIRYSYSILSAQAYLNTVHGDE